MDQPFNQVKKLGEKQGKKGKRKEHEKEKEPTYDAFNTIPP